MNECTNTQQTNVHFASFFFYKAKTVSTDRQVWFLNCGGAFSSRFSRDFDHDRSIQKNKTKQTETCPHAFYQIRGMGSCSKEECIENLVSVKIFTLDNISRPSTKSTGKFLSTSDVSLLGSFRAVRRDQQAQHNPLALSHLNAPFLFF